MHFFSRDGAYSPELFDRQTVDEFLCLFGMNGAETVWFSVVRSHFGQKLIVRNTGRCYQMEFFPDAALDLPGNVYCQFDTFLVFRYIQKSFVQ